MVDVARVEEQVREDFVTQLDSQFEFFVLCEDSISVGVLVDQNGAKAPVAAVGDAEGELEQVGQVRDEITLLLRVALGKRSQGSHA